MAVSKAQQRATNKYKKANYDRMELVVPKGRKDEIKAIADIQGQSVNAYIISAVDEKMERDGSGAASSSPPQAAESTVGSGVVSLVSLPPDTLEAAERGAEATGESVLDFVRRAIDTQAQRDKSSLKLGINPAAGGKLEKEA